MISGFACGKAVLWGIGLCGFGVCLLLKDVVFGLLWSDLDHDDFMAGNLLSYSVFGVGCSAWT